MIEQVSHAKQKPLNEWFKAGTPTDAIELVVKMLQFNPKKRPKISEILKNPYLANFSNAKEEIESKSIIKPPVSDNTKLGLKDYRSLIYDHIRRVYREKESSTGHSSLHNSSSVQRFDRPNTAQKGERHDSTGHYYFRNSSNNPKCEKPRTTETNKVHPSNILTGKTNVSSSFYEDEEKMKKKSSLKELLRNKKSNVTGYKGIN